MATKPLDQLSPAYRKRIERGLAAGKTRQQARGKKPGEHVIRKRKEIEAGKLTSSQKQQIKKFSKQQSARVEGSEPQEFYEAIIDHIGSDYQEFVRIRTQRNAEIKDYIARGKKVKWKMTEFMRINDDVAMIEWYFYH